MKIISLLMKIISLLLIISCFCSLLIISSTATTSPYDDDYYKDRTNVMRGAALAGKANVGFFGTTYVTGSANSTDGQRTHDCNSNSTFLNTRTSVSADTISKGGSTLQSSLFDVNGKKGSEATNPKYLMIFCFKLTKPATVDTARVFLDEINNGSLCARTLDSLDIALSATGEDGSWKIVHSVDKIYCGNNYHIYEDKSGNKTSYIEASFDPTETLYIRLCIPEPTCLHGQTEIKGDSIRYCRFTEIELWSVPKTNEDNNTTKPTDTSIKSTVLFPLLMKHRQYETETSTTMFGLRVKNLLSSTNSITFEKNGTKATVPGETLKELKLGGFQKLVVAITTPNATTVKITATAAGKVVESLAGTLVTMPWDSSKGIEVKAVDAQGNTTNATYDATSETVSFIANTMGVYSIVEGTAIDSPVTDPVSKDNFNWSNTSVVFIGDSITAGTGTTKTYHSYLSNMNIFKSVRSMGVGGSCISQRSDYGSKNSPLVGRYSSIPAADLIVVFMGTNDYGHETPLGTISDTSDVSFYGALDTVITGIQKEHPDSQLVFVTPLHRYGFGTSKITGTKFTYDNLPNGNGHKLEDYVNAIKVVCDKYAVPVIDLFNLCPITPENPEDKKQYFPDGLHPNEAGHEIIAKLIFEQLSLVPNPNPVDPDDTDSTAEQEPEISRVLMQYGNKFVKSYANDRTRATSEINIYLEEGQTVTILSTQNLQWALAKTDSVNSTSYSRYYPKNGWNSVASYTVAESGYYGLVLMKSDKSEFDFENFDPAEMSSYILIR